MTLKVSAMTFSPQYIVTLFTLAFSASLSIVTTHAKAEVRCEQFGNDASIVLGVDEEYYALPPSPKSSIALRFRYRDLGTTSSFHAGFDERELENPNWAVDKSNYVGLLTIHRRTLRWPKSVAEFLERNPHGRIVESNWKNWTKVERCSDCSEVHYVSTQWQQRGVDNVICLEDKNLDPLRQGCTARDSIAGLHVEYQFPAIKKEQFSSFRDRISLFLENLIAEGKQSCSSSQPKKE